MTANIVHVEVAPETTIALFTDPEGHIVRLM